MKIAIVDDELMYLKQLNETIRRELSVLSITAQTIDLFHSAEEFLCSWEKEKYNVIFLDIFIDQENGVDLARKIRETDSDVALVFCTTSNEFAAQSYEVDARYYLQKPITDEKVKAMLKRVNFVRLEKNQIIFLPDGYRCRLHKIQYTNYMNHSVIYYIEGLEPHNVYMAHGEAEKLLLPHEEFCTINKGNIVNFAMVDKITKNAFQMKNGELLPISRRRYKAVAEAYASYKLRQLEM